MIGIFGIPEEGFIGFPAHPEHGAAACPPLLVDHAPFIVNLLIFKSDVEGPVIKDQQCRIDNFRVGCGHFLEHVIGFIAAGEGIDLRAELHADRLEVIDNGFFVEVLRAIEGHMLGEVGQAILVRIFGSGADIDYEVKFSPFFRLPVFPHIVGHTVIELAVDNGSIQWYRGSRFVYHFLGQDCRGNQQKAQTAEEFKIR